MDGWLGRRFPLSSLAWQNLTRQRARSILAMAGIMIGVVAIASLGMFGATFQASYQDTVTDLARSVTVVPGEDLEADEFDDDHLARVQRYSSTPVYAVRLDAANVTIDGQTREMGLKSVDDPHTFTAAQQGYIPDPWRSEALVGNSLADSMDIVAGDSIKIEGQTVRVAAVLEPDAQAQVVGTENDILVPKRQLESEGINRMVIRTEDAQAARTLSSELDQELNDRRERYAVSDFTEFIDQIEQQLGLIQTFLLGVGAISLLVAAVSILNVMLMSTIERKGEIGVLRAVGYQKLDILRLMLTEALLLGLVGSILGLGLSVLMGMLINSQLLGDPFAFESSAAFYAVLGFAFGTGASLLSGVYPAWKAANARPVEALRD